MNPLFSIGDVLHLKEASAIPQTCAGACAICCCSRLSQACAGVGWHSERRQLTVFAYNSEKKCSKEQLLFKMVAPAKMDRHKAANAVAAAKVIYKLQADWKRQLPKLMEHVASHQRRCV